MKERRRLGSSDHRLLSLAEVGPPRQVRIRGEEMEPSDELLVRACQCEDAAAWEMLVRRYQRLLYNIPRRAGLDEDECADVFQQVFYKLLQKLDGIEQPEHIKAWLLTAAQRESWRLKRRERAIGSIASHTDEAKEA